MKRCWFLTCWTMKHREAEIQEQLCRWFRYQYPLLDDYFFHIPNGQNIGVKAGARLKKQGLKPGVPDLFLAVSCGGYHGLFLELKVKGGRLSEHQKYRIEKLVSQGYRVEVGMGFEASKAIIDDYLRQ